MYRLGGFLSLYTKKKLALLLFGKVVNWMCPSFHLSSELLHTMFIDGAREYELLVCYVKYVKIKLVLQHKSNLILMLKSFKIRILHGTMYYEWFNEVSCDILAKFWSYVLLLSTNSCHLSIKGCQIVR